MKRITTRLLESEAGFTKAVLDLLKICGWRSAHFRPARQGNKYVTPVQGDGVGFPDIIAVKGQRVLVAELKVGKNQPTPEQLVWLECWRTASVEVYVWRPSDWDEIERVVSHAQAKFTTPTTDRPGS